ncbi:uncharacterized protein I303_102368 [Kwoniella dejecticola CBS 10117]|uniref:DUF4383 domain-containing protein n=1 Tax=Kwoniella dejecticola CBS 10117 TaxID=1296121 RepID=A0A1A6AB59_9TREE|nr:uncharacterized protein I303_01492 [Kwoniella dejecticola CBS 10117]OBR87290.1 hypothetical protein I303_01492 [Kwoniella dejecticola CBS 10117]
MSSFKPAIKSFIPVIGLALVGSGTYGIIKPLNMAHIFGILNAGQPEVLFYPGLAGRNLAAGLAVFALNYQRQYKALGTFLFCWMTVGVVDTGICLTNPNVVNTWLHIMNIGILAVVSSGLLDWW